MDRIRYKCAGACKQWRSIEEVYFCPTCRKIICSQCTHSQIEIFSCPYCGKQNESSRMNFKTSQRNCPSCFLCPVCPSKPLLRPAEITGTVPIVDDEVLDMMTIRFSDEGDTSEQLTRFYEMRCAACNFSSSQLGVFVRLVAPSTVLVSPQELQEKLAQRLKQLRADRHHALETSANTAAMSLAAYVMANLDYLRLADRQDRVTYNEAIQETSGATGAHFPPKREYISIPVLDKKENAAAVRAELPRGIGGPHTAPGDGTRTTILSRDIAVSRPCAALARLPEPAPLRAHMSLFCPCRTRLAGQLNLMERRFTALTCLPVFELLPPAHGKRRSGAVLQITNPTDSPCRLALRYRHSRGEDALRERIHIPRRPKNPDAKWYIAPDGRAGRTEWRKLCESLITEQTPALQFTVPYVAGVPPEFCPDTFYVNPIKKHEAVCMRHLNTVCVALGERLDAINELEIAVTFEYTQNEGKQLLKAEYKILITGPKGG
eukprot:gnl/Chilomastix_cuspidata/1093.p1 GENE.gnl/Chilomastix_cuspidata/1093~~gnl/Chilomastix_cuspidata/1093.p1  ORF type:complete len:490 (+),score=148.67 gnl/Chilomastix_cuspidata/1093:246-1715(+)